MDDELELNQEQIFEQLQHFLNSFAGELNIMEDQIDVAVQMEYFNYTSKVKDNNNIDELLSRIAILTSDTESIQNKQELLCRLASVDDVQAYRAIETYMNEVKGTEMYNWTRLALEESKMLLHTKLLDQKQLFISTGLGGKGNKLRYFVVLIPENTEPLAEYQQNIVRKEFEYAFIKQEAEIEAINYNEQYITLMVLVPINILLTDLFSKAIDECNQFGNFLKRDCIITNVKPLNYEEITKIVNNPDNIDPELNNQPFNN